MTSVTTGLSDQLLELTETFVAANLESALSGNLAGLLGQTLSELECLLCNTTASTLTSLLGEFTSLTRCLTELLEEFTSLAAALNS